MLELAVLGALKERPMSGYELRKQLAERLAHARTYSYSSLNGTLRKLARAGAVDKQAQDTGGRRKDVYSITDHGESILEGLLDESGPNAAEDRDTFLLRLSLFRYTKPETRRRVLERRRGYLLDQLERITDTLKKMRERMDAYSLELIRYSESEMTHDIRWLDDMIEAERQSAPTTTRAAQKRTRKGERRTARATKRTSVTEPASLEDKSVTTSVAQ